MAATTDEQLTQLEKDIRQLQIEYDTYFTGGRPRPPADTEWRVQSTIKRFSEMGDKLKFAERFRFNGLASRYAKYSEIWRQRAKKVEAGHSAYSYSKVARELEAKRLAEAERKHEAYLHGERGEPKAGRVAFSDPLKETEKMQELYHTMLDAKGKAGEKADVNFEQFHAFVRNKTEQLKKQMGCQKVEYEVSVEAGQVKLKAKGV